MLVNKNLVCRKLETLVDIHYLVLTSKYKSVLVALYISSPSVQSFVPPSRAFIDFLGEHNYFVEAIDPLHYNTAPSEQ